MVFDKISKDLGYEDGRNVVMQKDDLLERIRVRNARIGVIGLGYVGLPLVLRFGEERFPVIGFDIDPDKVSKLNAGQSYIHHIPAARLQTLLKEGQFEATSDFRRLDRKSVV